MITFTQEGRAIGLKEVIISFVGSSLEVTVVSRKGSERKVCSTLREVNNWLGQWIRGLNE